MDIHIYESQMPEDDVKFIIGVLLQLLHKVEKMSESQDKLVADLKEVRGIVVKIKGESSTTLAKVVTLEAMLADAGGIPEEVVDLVAEIKAGVTNIDELVPDAPVE